MEDPSITVKPSDFKKVHLIGSLLRNGEKEKIAGNILKLALHSLGDEWKPFSFDDYREFCTHDVCTEERVLLDDMTEDGYFTKTAEGLYDFTPKVIMSVYFC